MLISPLYFKPDQDADTLALTDHEHFTIDLPCQVSEMKPGQDVAVSTDTGKVFHMYLPRQVQQKIFLYFFIVYLSRWNKENAGRKLPVNGYFSYTNAMVTTCGTLYSYIYI